MAERFYCDDEITGPTALLRGAEAHHLAHVMRKTAGQDVIVFDGTGKEYAATISSVSRREVTLSIQGGTEVSRELRVRLWVAAALPKGDRQQWMVQKMAELGVSRLIPLDTRRSVAKPKESALQRLRRHVVEASKQCGRNHLMQIHDACGLDRLKEVIPENMECVLADPSGDAPLPQQRRDVCVVVGPEGGFDESELRQARQNQWVICTLGARMLRIETAAVAAAAWFSLQDIADGPVPEP